MKHLQNFFYVVGGNDAINRFCHSTLLSVQQKVDKVQIPQIRSHISTKEMMKLHNWQTMTNPVI